MLVDTAPLTSSSEADSIYSELEGQRERVILPSYSTQAFSAIVSLLPIIIINSSLHQMLPPLQRKKGETSSTDSWYQLMVNSVIAMRSYE